MTPDWIVSQITLTAEAQECLEKRGNYNLPHYRLRVEGTNLNFPKGHIDRPFSWRVHDVADPRFDLTNAEIENAAKPYLGRKD